MNKNEKKNISTPCPFMWYALAQSQTMMHRDEFCHESPSNAKAQIVIDRLLNGMWGKIWYNSNKMMGELHHHFFPILCP